MTTLSTPTASVTTSLAFPPLLHRIWNFLVEPSLQIKEPDKRQQARFVSALLFVSSVMVFVMLINEMFFTGSAPRLPIPVYLGIIAISFCYYVLSRTKYNDIAIILFVATTVIDLIVVYAINPSSGSPFEYTVFAILIPGILLSVRVTTIIAVAIIAAMVLVSRLVKSDQDLTKTINFIAVFAIIVIVFVIFRNLLENTRRRQITDALAKVETLNLTLSQKNEELLKANAVAKEAARLKSEFMATMSHELRTPLNAVLGFSGILLQGMGGEFDDETRHMVERIQQNSNRLLGLINDVLDIAKIEAGRMDLVSVPMNPRKMVENWHSQMSVLAERKNLAFNVEIDPDMPEQIFGDVERISQIAINLLSNAFKFTETGSVTLALIEQGTTWQIKVSDTGIGIPPHAMNYIFDEFRQLDGTSKRAYGGTGLGLAIVRNLCRMMEGTIQVESKLDAGSTFTVTLPLRLNSALLSTQIPR